MQKKEATPPPIAAAMCTESICAMNGDLLSRSARSWLRTIPGINVAENCGTRPDA